MTGQFFALSAATFFLEENSSGDRIIDNERLHVSGVVYRLVTLTHIPDLLEHGEPPVLPEFADDL